MTKPIEQIVQCAKQLSEEELLLLEITAPIADNDLTGKIKGIASNLDTEVKHE